MGDQPVSPVERTAFITRLEKQRSKVDITRNRSNQEFQPAILHLIHILLTLYKHFNEKDHLIEGVQSLRELIERSTQEDRRNQKLLLAENLVRLFHRNTSNTELLNEAIEIYESYFWFANSLDTNTLSDLLACYALRYRHISASVEDLRNNIEQHRKLLDLVSDDDKDKPRMLNNLSDQLRDTFKISPEIEVLNESIDLCQRAVHIASTQQQNRVIFQHNLGQRYHDRYLHTSQLDDLNESVRLARHVMSSAELHSSFKPQALNALASRLSSRSGRVGFEKDFDESLDLQLQAVRLVDSSSIDAPIFRYNLSAKYYARWAAFRNYQDLENAIQSTEAALAVAPSQKALYSHWLHQAGRWLEESYDIQIERGNVDLDARNKILMQAIQYVDRALTESTIGDPSRSVWLNTLGRLHQRMWRETGDWMELEEAVRLYSVSANHEPGVTFSRLHGARLAILALAQFDPPRWNDAAEFANLALLLLPKLALRGNATPDHIHVLHPLRNLSPIITAVLIHANRPAVEVLQALERSRGIIASLPIFTRAISASLGTDKPTLNERYLHTLDSLRSIPDDQSLNNYHDRSKRRQAYIQHLENLEKETVVQGNVAPLLTSLAEEELFQIAGDGHLVCYNVSSLGSNAIIVSNKVVRILELPHLTIPFVQKLVNLFPTYTGLNRDGESEIVVDETDEEAHSPLVAPEQRLHEGLRDLWTLAVCPVLDSIGGTLLPGHSLPHVHWVGGGLMSLLPLHAAGDNRVGCIDNTFSRAISSYAPSLKSLSHSSNNSKIKQLPSQLKLLAVGVPNTVGYSAINSKVEINAITKHCGTAFEVKELWSPERKKVLEGLKECNIVHFACHGRANLARPWESGLLLGRETLRVSDIDQCDGLVANIAYLSACSTAELGFGSLLSESIHLASSFQIAGFQHVVGTIMKARDEAAVQIADNFYRLLRDRKDLETLDVAAVLHEAISRFRKQGNNSENVLAWCPFVHFGR